MTFKSIRLALAAFAVLFVATGAQAQVTEIRIDWATYDSLAARR